MGSWEARRGPRWGAGEAEGCVAELERLRAEGGTVRGETVLTVLLALPSADEGGGAAAADAPGAPSGASPPGAPGAPRQRLLALLAESLEERGRMGFEELEYYLKGLAQAGAAPLEPGGALRRLVQAQVQLPEGRRKKLELARFLGLIDSLGLDPTFGPLDPPILNGLLLCAPSPRLLLGLVRGYGPAFSFVNSCTAVHRLAKLPQCRRARLARRRLRQRPLGRVPGRGAHLLAVGDAEDEFKSTPEFGELLGIVDCHLDQYDAQGLSMVWWGFSQLGYVPPQGFVERFEQNCARLVGRTNVQAVSNILWGYSVQRLTPSPDLLAIYTARLEACAERGMFSGQHVANSLYALAHFGGTSAAGLPASVLHALEGEVERLAEGLLCCELVMVLVAFKRLGMNPQPSVMEALEEQLLKKVPYFKHRELTLALWSLSQLGHQVPDDLMNEFSLRIPGVLQDEACEAEDVARVFYAYAKMSYTPPAVQLEGLRRALEVHMERLEPNHVCCVAWAVATMPDAFVACLARPGRAATPGAPPLSLMDRLCETAADRVSEFDMGQLVWLMWSLATLNLNVEPRNMSRFMQEIDSRMYYVSESDLVGLLWAAARLNFSAYGALGNSIFQRSEEAAQYHLHKMSPGKITSLLWSYATAAYVPRQELVQAMLGRFRAQRLEFYPLQIERVSWATKRLRELQAEQQGVAAGEEAPLGEAAQGEVQPSPEEALEGETRADVPLKAGAPVLD